MPPVTRPKSVLSANICQAHFPDFPSRNGRNLVHMQGYTWNTIIEDQELSSIYITVLNLW